MLISAAQAHIAVVYFMIVAVSLYGLDSPWRQTKISHCLGVGQLLGFFVTQRNFASAPLHVY
ncbi:hypothetical protein AB4Y42_02045 [Paraburkholderia sp. EG286B]|uniref:hypothetical protein n=1 Tax=Paraburkholderia sp. EG286B TaxID=3237011 RepID=UPI0034D15B63